MRDVAREREMAELVIYQGLLNALLHMYGWYGNILFIWMMRQFRTPAMFAAMWED